jgi:hypothetical protein
MQLSGFRSALGVLYDADFGARIGPALGLCLLYGLDGKNECRVTSISVSKPSLRAAGCAEIFGRFYAGAVSGAFGAVGRNLPTGLADGDDPGDTPLMKALIEKKTAEGKPAYDHGLQSLNDTAEPAPLLRNALTAQADQNCVVVLNGPATNLAKLLDLHNAKGWIERKARVLMMVDGVFTTGDHRAAARKVLAEWPGPIMFVPSAVGEAVPYPAASIDTDFSWSPSHPLVDAYRAAGTMPYDAPSTEMAAVLHAVREKEKLFGVSETGSITISNDGKATFAPGAGKHRQLVLDPANKEKILKTYIELVTAKPVPRMPRFRSQQNVDPAKPAAAAKPDPAKK